VIVSTALRISTAILASVLSVAASMAGAAPPAPTIRVMPFNVRYSAAQDGASPGRGASISSSRRSRAEVRPLTQDGKEG
jgi:hypothetical protein